MPGPLETRRMYMSKKLTMCLSVFELCFLLSVSAQPAPQHEGMCPQTSSCVTVRCTELGIPVGHLRCETHSSRYRHAEMQR